MHPAQSARIQKEKHPERYCSKCLWRTEGGDCPRHTTRTLDFPSTRPKLICANCGEVKDENRHKTCMTVEPDANPHGLPVNGVHEDIEESK